MADEQDPFAKFARGPAEGSADTTGPWNDFQADIQSDDDGPWNDYRSIDASDPFAKFARKSIDHSPIAWSDVGQQALNNLGPSAANTAAAIAHPFLHPIETAQSLYDIGNGAVSKAEGALGVQQSPDEKARREASLDAVTSFFANRYGSIEKFKHAIAEDPAGVAMDLSTVLAPASLAARGPGIVGKVGSVAKVANEFVDPIIAASKVIPKAVEPVVSTVLGRTTGAGADPIRTAFRAGTEGNQVFLDNMRGAAPMSDTVDMAKSAVSDMGKDRSAGYQAGMTGINADKTVLSLNPIKQAIASADTTINKVGPTGKVFVKDQEAADRLAEMQKIIADHEAAYPNPTAADLDDLKQSLYEVQARTKPGTLARKTAGAVYNAAKNTIIKQAPNYADTMKAYADASNKMKELTNTFSLGEKASQDTALRKLQSVMRNNVDTNYGQRTRLLDELATYEPDLPFALAGQSLSSAGPRGLSGLGALELGGAGGLGYLSSANPMAALGTLVALPAFSPRLVGEAAYYAGAGLGAMRRVPGVSSLSLRPASIASKPAYQAGRASEEAEAEASRRGGIGPR